jgi:hypothetical protein
MKKEDISILLGSSFGLENLRSTAAFSAAKQGLSRCDQYKGYRFGIWTQVIYFQLFRSHIQTVDHFPRAAGEVSSSLRVGSHAMFRNQLEIQLAN